MYILQTYPPYNYIECAKKCSRNSMFPQIYLTLFLISTTFSNHVYFSIADFFAGVKISCQIDNIQENQTKMKFKILFIQFALNTHFLCTTEVYNSLVNRKLFSFYSFMRFCLYTNSLETHKKYYFIRPSGWRIFDSRWSRSSITFFLKTEYQCNEAIVQHTQFPHTHWSCSSALHNVSKLLEHFKNIASLILKSIFYLHIALL